MPEDEIYLDVETLRLSDEVPGGWENIRQFGLAVAVTWDAPHSFRHWFEVDAHSLVAELARFSCIITFNGERFDLEVLRGYTGIDHLKPKSLDLLNYLKGRLGHRVRLTDLAHDTLGSQKTGTGLEAVQWWRAGDTPKVIEYCRQDVQLLVDLVRFARQNGFVVVGAQRVPVDWR